MTESARLLLLQAELPRFAGMDPTQVYKE